MKSATGYSFSLGLTFRDPSPKSASSVTHPDDQSFVAGRACAFDPALDAALPIRVSVRALTSGFDTPVGVALHIDDSLNYNVTGSDVEVNYSDGVQCKQPVGSNSISVSWSDALQKGQTRSIEAFVIVKNFYSPAAPSGDRTLLHAIGLGPDATFAGDQAYGTDWTTVDLTGAAYNG
jgi:hypothetical protein